VSTTSVPGPTTLSEPSRGFGPLRLSEAWAHRELLLFFAWRDLSVRYRQTLLGIAWAVIQPALMVIVFTAVLGRFARIPSDGLPYPVFALCGMLPWQSFATALGSGSNSLASGAALLTKVYFPRVLLPVSAVVPAIVDLVVGLLVLAPVLLFYGVKPGRSIVLLPILALLPALVALAVSLWTSALSVRYRDVRHVLPFLTQLWLFATPVVYPATLFPERWRTLAALNPMWGTVEAFRACLVGQPIPVGALSLSLASAVTLGVIGAFLFRRMERVFADEV
jgi:lipopolysaccharide transport system permease protein